MGWEDKGRVPGAKEKEGGIRPNCNTLAQLPVDHASSGNWVPYSSQVYGVCNQSTNCTCSLASVSSIHDGI